MASGGGQEDPFGTGEKQPQQPTKEQEEFVSGFEKALNGIHQSRGVPLNVFSRQYQQPESQASSSLSSTSSFVNNPRQTIHVPSASLPVAVEQCLAIQTPSPAKRVAVPRLVGVARPLTSAGVNPSSSTTAIRVTRSVTNVDSIALDDRKQQRMITTTQSFNDLDRAPDGIQLSRPTSGGNWTVERVAHSSGYATSTSRAPLPLVIESANNTQFAASPSSAAQPQHQCQQPCDDGELDPKKIRNRNAAMKCRQKKLEHINEMKRHLTETTENNEELRAKLAEFQACLSTMNSLLQEHRGPQGTCRISYCQ